MQNLVFIQTIKENKNDPQISVLIREFALSEFRKSVKGAKNGDANAALAKEFEQICEALKGEDLLNRQNVANLIQSAGDALSEAKEQYIHRLIYEKEQIERQIYAQKDEIKNDVRALLENMENFIKNSDLADKDEILTAIDEKMLCELQMLGILKETTEAAFLTAIEKGDDVKDTVEQIAKNVVLSAINEGEASKERILEIARTVCEAACEIADVDQAFAKELISGAIGGVREALGKRTEKFIEEIKFAPDGQTLLGEAKEFIRLEERFVAMLRDMARSEEPSAAVINEILDESVDSYFAKFKRLQNDVSRQIELQLEELKFNENIDKFASLAGAKFEELKREVTQAGDKLKENFNAKERIEALKKEINDFEKRTEEKLTEISASEIGENLKAKSKELGEKLYKAAENLIKTAKEKIGKKEDEKKDE